MIQRTLGYLAQRPFSQVKNGADDPVADPFVVHQGRYLFDLVVIRLESAESDDLCNNNFVDRT
jgi:hypothetical protein